jgi:AraC-like DNA-binding protein
VNYSYACRLFQRFCKETPQDYLLRLRVHHALQRLHYTDESVKKVALDLGYADPYVFSKVFKRVLGVAPSHLRREGVELTHSQ